MEYEDPRVEELRRREVARNIPLIVVVGIVLVLGIIGNAFSFAFYGFSRKRTVTNFLIAALALNDLTANIVFCDELALVLQSFTFRDRAGCKTVFVINNWILINSVVLLAVIAIDRYRRICHPFSRQMSKRVAWFAVVGVTVVTFCLTLREAFLAEIVKKSVKMNDNSTVFGYFCTHTADKTYAQLITVSHVVNITLFFGSVIVMAVLYILVIRKVVKTKALLNVTCKSVFKKENSSTSAATESTGVSDGGKTPQDSKDQSQTTSNAGSPILEKSDNSKMGQETDILMTKREPVNEQCFSNNAALNNTSPDEGNTEKKGVGDKKAIVSFQASSYEKTEDIDNVKNDYGVEKSITKMIIVFSAASILSFVPYFAAMFMPRHVSTEDNLSNFSKKVARQFYMLNCVVNPYIMCYFNTSFRRFIKSFICRRTCQLSE